MTWSMPITRLVAVLMVLAGLAGGVGVGLGLSYRSIGGYASRPQAAATAAAQIAPTVAPSPTPAVLAAGKLASGARLIAFGGVLVGSGSGGLFQSEDKGVTWAPVQLPAGAASLVIAPSDPKRRITGGTSVRFSDDSGATWKEPKAAPPGPGPFTPLAINPNDRDVWFVAAHSKVLRTRDGGISWRELAGLPSAAGSMIVSTGRADAFVLSSGGQVYELTDNGSTVHQRASLPGSATVTDLAVAANSAALVLLARASDGHDYLDSGGGWSGGVPLSGSISAVPGGWALVADAAGRPTGGEIRVSSDAGQTWLVAHGLPANQSVDAVATQDKGGLAAYAYCFGGDVYVSPDGRNWALLSSALRA